jgi:hypothetical protein
MAGFVRHAAWHTGTPLQRNVHTVAAANRAQDGGDRLGDGTPDFLRLTDPAAASPASKTPVRRHDGRISRV